jgi:phage terminase large subunit GpA-like protein
MDAVNDPDIDTIVVMSSSQIGKTEIVCNIVGYFISQDPGPMLVVQPTLDMAQTWSKDRFAPMLRDTDILRGTVNSPKTRDSNNTIQHKAFPGGHITIAGANSPANLASRPIRIVLCDEIDRYPASAGAEGDPVSLAIKRSTTFWNRLNILISTPTIKELSRIEAAYEKSDQRRFFVPCPKCKFQQILRWSNVVWNKNEKKKNLPHTAKYKCENCSELWNDAKRWAAIRKGEWKVTAESQVQTNIAGFHINEIYSPWVKLEEMVSDFLEKKDNPETLKTFVNTSLGESWEEDGERIESTDLYQRREKYSAEVPMGGLVLTAGVDVQDDRVEVEVVAWGIGDESWSIDYIIIHGNPASVNLWKDLDDKLQTKYEHESGINLAIVCVCVDTGGHFTEQVYSFVRDKLFRRIYAIKGSNTLGKPLISRPSNTNKGRVKLFSIGTDTAKQTIFYRLKMDETGPGYMHFPIKYDDEYFEQLTAEKATVKYSRGFPHRVWVKTRARNDVLDCRVYAMAALAILNPNYKLISKKYSEVSKRTQEIEDESTKQNISNIRKTRNTWATGWIR